MLRERFTQLLNQINQFLQRGYHEGNPKEEKHRAAFINALFITGFILTIISGTARIVLKEYVVVLLDYIGALTIFTFLRLFHRSRNYIRIAYVLNILLALIFFLLLATRESTESVFVWYYAVPLIATFLLGAVRGAVLSLIHMSVTVVYLAFISGTWNTTVYSADLVGRFVSSYFVVISFAYLFQWLKERSIANLQQKTEELTKTQRSLEMANRAKSDFLANMSHELRTPLNHIVGFTELSYSGRLGEIGEPHKEHLGYVLESSRHLLSLIEDILDTSKIEAGKEHLNIEEILLDDFLEHTAEMFKESALANDIELIVAIETKRNSIEADPLRLQQIVNNLISNALKFTPDGGIVSIRIQDNGKDTVLFSVADSGLGIDSKDAERIFEPFYQIRDNYPGSIRGTGLGLSLSNKLVELHGGHIWVESDGPGKGSVFNFVIPVHAKTGKYTSAS